MTSISCERESLRRCLGDAIEFRNRNRSDERDAAYFEWRYLDRPCDVEAYVVWVSDGGERLGAATVAPHDFLIDGESVRFGIVGDISVSPSAQGRGVGSLLLRSVREELPPGVDDVLVLPNDAAEGPLARAGWSTIGAIERRVRLLSGVSSAGLAHKAIAFVSGILSAVAGGNSDCEIRGAVTSLEDIDAVWSAIGRSGVAMARRDAAYIRWRYANHPTTAYDISVLTKRDEPVGWVVSHIADGSRWIDDFAVADPGDMVALVGCLSAQTRSVGGVSSIHVRSFDAMDHSAWSRNGFIRRGDTQTVMIGGAVLERLSDRNVWHITAGDKDV